MTIILLAVFGLGLLAVALASFFYAQRMSRREALPPNWKLMRLIAFGAGVVLAAASMFFAYPFPDREGRPAAAMGVPFFMGYIDHLGQRHYGFLAAPGIALNLTLWCLLPQIPLALIGRRHRGQPPRGEERESSD